MFTKEPGQRKKSVVDFNASWERDSAHRSQQASKDKGGGELMAAFESVLKFRVCWCFWESNWAGPIYYPHIISSHWCSAELVPRPYITWTWTSYVLLGCLTPQGILTWKSASEVLQKRSGKISLNLALVIAFGISQQRGVGNAGEKILYFSLFIFHDTEQSFFPQGSCSAELIAINKQNKKFLGNVLIWLILPQGTSK